MWRAHRVPQAAVGFLNRDYSYVSINKLEEIEILKEAASLNILDDVIKAGTANFTKYYSQLTAR